MAFFNTLIQNMSTTCLESLVRVRSNGSRYRRYGDSKKNILI